MSLRMYLMSKVILDTGCNWTLAMEAVASTAIEHPEWPSLSERRTWDAWSRAGF